PVAAGDNWTWESMPDAAKRLTRDLNGDDVLDQFGIDTVTRMAWEQFVHQAGGPLYNEILFPTERSRNSEPVQAATKFARQLLRDDRVVGGSLTAGTAAMSFTASAQVKDQLTAVGFAWDMSLHAKGPHSRASIFGIGGIQLVTTSARKEAAWKWIEFLTLDPDSVRRYVQTNQRIPPLVSVQGEFAALVPHLSDNWMALIDAVAQPNSATL